MPLPADLTRKALRENILRYLEPKEKRDAEQ